MKLLFDQNLSWRLPKKLADLYPDSQHIREVGMKESQDVDIWDYAKANGFVIVSKDLDLSATQFVVWTPAESCAVARRQLHSSNDRRFVAAVFDNYLRIRARCGKVLFSVAVIDDGETEQVIGRERETATFLSASLVSLTLCVIGFAPRRLRR